MPRIDPLQLLKCLSVLLSPEGGILSRDEVPRLVNLMTKFSKKLVSKSIYVLILKSTETSLVDMFMAEGGWTLIQTWIQDAVLLNNWVLVREILELLLVTPVDVERLKMNCLPKLIKSLSRREDLDGVAKLSDQIVQKWLTIVKGTTPATVGQPQPEAASQPQTPAPVQVEQQAAITPVNQEKIEDGNIDNEDNIESIKTATFYKSEKDSNPISREMVDSDCTIVEGAGAKENDDVTVSNESEKKKEDAKKEKHSKSSKSSSSSSSSSSSKRDKNKDRHRSSSSHSSSKSKSSSRDKDRYQKDRSDKEKSGKDKRDDRKDRDKSRDKDKERRSSSSKSSSKDKSRSKERSKDKDRDQKYSKEKQAEKDKDTLAKIKPVTIDKLGRIPKKTGDEKEKSKDTGKDEKKKPAFSILDKKTEERAKTVKVFNSKMRSTGLEEEVKPPPPRSALKKSTSSVQLPTIPQKRPSPTRDLSSSSVPPEKKIKIDKVDLPERPGAIKLIPPKPKPMLQESDMFMDALTASATKKPAKRKRRPSQSKEVPASPTTTTPTTTTESATLTSPTTSIKHHIAPINFYQDTLTEETVETSNENKDGDKRDNTKGRENDADTPASPNSNPGTPLNQVEAEDDDSSDDNLPLKMPKLNAQGLKSVLLHAKKKGPKRSIQWKAEENLVEVRYFELDETERVNVTRTFTDMAKMEMTSEREALIMSRKPSLDDTMEPQIPWRLPILCERPEPPAVPGSKSLEKDIQFAREKSVLQALYFDKRRIPDSPEEPIPENHQMSDPIIIPLEDPESQEIDLRTTPWPEPKGMQVIEPQLPAVFNQNMSYNPNFPMVPPQFAGMPPPQRFGPPGGPPIPAMAGNFGPPMMGPPNMMPPPPEMMAQGYMPGPHEAYPGSEGYPGPPPFNGPPGPNMNLYGPPGNYNNYRGSPRGNFRRGGNNAQGGGWVRMNTPNNWKRGGGRGGPNNNRVCKNITNHGYCRNGDNCQWFHPSQ